MTRLPVHADGPVGRIARIILLSYLAAACSAWRVQPEPPAELAPPARSRISLADGSHLYLRDVRVRSDTLFGTAESDDSLRVAIPMSAVRRIEVPDERPQHLVSMTLVVLLGITLVVSALLSYGLHER